MLDFISSKVGMIIAAVIISGTVIGFFAWQRAGFEDIERQKTAGFIADHIDHVSSLSSSHRELVTFNHDREKQGVYINPRIAGNPYTLTITGNLVILKQDGEEDVISSLTRRIHPWNPEVIRGEDVLNDTVLQKIDLGNRSVEIRSGMDFYIEIIPLNMTSAEIPLETVYHTFVYIP